MNSSVFGELLEELCLNKNVVEFGGGGSTFQISKIARTLTTIESDKYFANLLKSKLEFKSTSCPVYILYANIGITKIYGAPIDSLSFIYRNRYPSYTDIYFKNLISYPPVDVIIIDGRFRLATALATLLHINHRYTLIFDDYYSRDYYHVFDEFSKTGTKLGDTLIVTLNPLEVDRQRVTYLYNLSKFDGR